MNPLIRFVSFGFYIAFDFLCLSSTKDATLTSSLSSFSRALPGEGVVGTLLIRQKTEKIIFEQTHSKQLLHARPLLVQVLQTNAHNNPYDQDKVCNRLLSPEIIQCDFYLKK